MQEQQNADRKGGWARFIVLAVLFIFIQILGIYFGFKWEFAGTESKEASEDKGDFRNSAEFVNFWNAKRAYIASKANEKLSILQSKNARYIKENSNNSSDFNQFKESRNFGLYNDMLENEQKNIKRKSQKQNELDELRMQLETQREKAKLKAELQSLQNFISKPNNEPKITQGQDVQIQQDTKTVSESLQDSYELIKKRKKEFKILKENSLLPDFNGAKVYVIGAGLVESKKGYVKPQILNSLKLFWSEYFKKSNVKLIEIGTPALKRGIK